MNLTELSKQVYEANKKKGFWSMRHRVAMIDLEGTDESDFIRSAIRDQMLMLVVSELGEAVDAARKGRFCTANEVDKATDITNDDGFEAWFSVRVKDTLEDEIADAVIRLLDLCGGLGIDIDWHVKQKLRYNALRPHKHGKAY